MKHSIVQNYFYNAIGIFLFSGQADQLDAVLNISLDLQTEQRERRGKILNVYSHVVYASFTNE